MNRKLKLNILFPSAAILGLLVWGTVLPLKPVRATDTVYYVKPGAAGDCSDWGHACDLPTALDNAQSGDEIWVSAGTYLPTETNGTDDRTATFNLKSDVMVYGGFPATGAPEFEDRDWEMYPTILSGDIGDPNVIADNSYHVVTASNVTGVTLDGFTITQGNANGDVSLNNDSGGGMFVYLGSLTLSHVIFAENEGINGGGMNNSFGSLTLNDVSFAGNSATYGGGIYGHYGTLNLDKGLFKENTALNGGGFFAFLGTHTLTNVEFRSNTATQNNSAIGGWGAGLYNSSASLTLTDVTFYRNKAQALEGNISYGGGLYTLGGSLALEEVAFTENEATYGGGFYTSNGTSSLTNVTFEKNTAQNGGGLYNIGQANVITLINVAFIENSANPKGGGLYNDNSNPVLTHVTFSENEAESGGGMYISNNSSPSLANVTITRNTALWGAGIYTDNSSPSLTHVTFSENNAFYSGGGLSSNFNSHPVLTDVTFTENTADSGGGLYNFNSDPTLTNVTFSKNEATYGGAIGNYGSSPSLTNVTITRNEASMDGGGIYNTVSSSPTLTNVILWDNKNGQIYDAPGSTADVSYSIVQGGFPGINNLDEDPVLLPLADNGGFTLTHALAKGSPAIDAGDGTNCPTKDQRGAQRPQDGDEDGVPACDIGAYEYDPQQYMLIVTVSPPGAGSVTTTPSGDFHFGDRVMLTPVANLGWVFSYWDGDPDRTENPLEIEITGDMTVTAYFEQGGFKTFLPLILR